MNIEPNKKETEFIASYLETIAFTEDNQGVLDEDFMRESVVDCLAFFSRVCCYLSDDQIAPAGHDFWLTRNGHGAGFWDGDWPKYGDMFTEISKSFGEVHPLFEPENTIWPAGYRKAVLTLELNENQIELGIRRFLSRGGEGDPDLMTIAEELILYGDEHLSTVITESQEIQY